MSNVKQVALALSIGLLAAAPLTYAADTGELSQQKLEKYSQAQEKIMDISQDYRQRLNGAQGEDEAMKLKTAARQEMAGAVTATGLTVQEYNKITQAAQEDPKVRERLRRLQ